MQLKSLGTLALVGGLLATPGVASVGYARADVIQAPSDDTLKDRIEYKLETSKLVRKYGVNVKVVSRVVTLTGDVATAEQKAEAARLAKIDGVSRVDNMITIDPDEDKTVTERVKKGVNKAGEAITDAWIFSKVKWYFVGDDVLKGSDIDVDVKDRVVTLNGTVRSAAGRARAVELATDTDGVSKVVNNLVIK